MGPFWDVFLGHGVTLGRVAIATGFALLVLDLWRAPSPRPRPSIGVWAFIAAMLLLGLWIAEDAATWGCNCGGQVTGYGEVCAAAILAALVCGLEPRWRAPLVLVVGAAAALSALLALG